jgi:hypothetical protein
MLPVIRLEIEGMKHEISHYMSEHVLQLDQDIRNAIEKFCTMENIQLTITAEVLKQLDIAISEEVRNFFTYHAEGRAKVREAVEKYLGKETWRDEQTRKSNEQGRNESPDSGLSEEAVFRRDSGTGSAH